MSWKEDSLKIGRGAWSEKNEISEGDERAGAEGGGAAAAGEAGCGGARDIDDCARDQQSARVLDEFAVPDSGVRFDGRDPALCGDRTAGVGAGHGYHGTDVALPPAGEQADPDRPG